MLPLRGLATHMEPDHLRLPMLRTGRRRRHPISPCIIRSKNPRYTIRGPCIIRSRIHTRTIISQHPTHSLPRLDTRRKGSASITSIIIQDSYTRVGRILLDFMVELPE